MEDIGEPLQLFSFSEEGRFEIDRDVLDQVLLRDELKDVPINIVSISGAYRTGKSFTMNFLNMYLASNRDPHWLDDEDQLVRGFRFRGGSKRETIGIWIWSRPFIITTKNGPVAVILLDTQGLFDSKTTTVDNTKIFATSTMLSSVQILNLMRNIQEDNLQYLRFFVEFGSAAFQKAGHNMLASQSLIFLVRDWFDPGEYPYGNTGGEELLKEKLKIEKGQASEMQDVRNHLLDTFGEISAFLLPKPGDSVEINSGDEIFTGQLKDIKKNFRLIMKDFVEYLLRDDRMLYKMTDDRPMRSDEVYQLFLMCAEVFRNDLPCATNAYDACSRNSYEVAVKAAECDYDRLMKKECTNVLAINEFEAAAQRCQEAALAKFEHSFKLKSRNNDEEYRQRLLENIERLQESFFVVNKYRTENVDMIEIMNLLRADLENSAKERETMRKEMESQNAKMNEQLRELETLKKQAEITQKQYGAALKKIEELKSFNEERYRQSEKKCEKLEKTMNIMQWVSLGATLCGGAVLAAGKAGTAVLSRGAVAVAEKTGGVLLAGAGAIGSATGYVYHKFWKNGQTNSETPPEQNAK